MRAKRKINGLLLLAGILASSGLAHAATCRAKPEEDCKDGKSPIIPVRIYRNFLVIAEGKIGGAPESQNFIIDTGTSPSIVNENLVKELGLATTPSAFRALGKSSPGLAAVVPEIDLGPIRAASLPVQVESLTRLEREFGIPIAGILGMDVLSKSNFRLDYDKAEMEFGDIIATGIPVHFDTRAKIAVAEVRIGGKEARFLVDTGSDSVVLFGRNFPDAGWLTLRQTPQSGNSLADQRMFVQVFSAADIILGGQHFVDDRAYFVPGNSDPAFDGLLGVRALGFRSFSYDQASTTIFLQR